VEAAKLLGIEAVPTCRLSHLSAGHRRLILGSSVAHSFQRFPSPGQRSDLSGHVPRHAAGARERS
jgi:hypothetical protein